MTIPAMLERCAQRAPEAPALGWKPDGKTLTTFSYRQLRERTVALAAGLAELGWSPGRWFITLGDGSGNAAMRFWTLVLGGYHLGCPAATLGGRRLDELLETLDRCDPVAVVTESEKTYALVLEALAHSSRVGKPTPMLIRLEESPKPPETAGSAETASSAETSGASGLAAPPTPPSSYDAVLSAGEAALAASRFPRDGVGPAKPDDVTLILLTSGSTGRRKAVPLTHANFYHSYAPALARLGLGPTDTVLQYMPAAHVLAHTLVYGLLHVGARMLFTAPERLIRELAPSGATVLPAPPRVGQAVMNRVEHEIAGRSWPVRTLYRLATAGSAGFLGWPTPLNWLCAPLHALGRALFYRKIRAQLGSVRMFVFGSAPLPYAVQRWLYTIGIIGINGYGLTEAPVVATSFPEHGHRLGSIGSALAGSEFKFLDEAGRDTDDGGRPLRRGNLCLRGGPVLASYYRDAESTAESIRDGWFVTGDLAHVDAHGELWIEGRLKDIVVPISGENLAPVPVESAIAACPYVEQVVIVGDGCKSIGALVVPNFERLRTWAAEQGVSDAERADDARLIATAAVRELYRHEVKSRTGGLEALAAHGGAIGRVELLAEPFSVENGLLTPDVRKIRRRAIYERYDKQIQAMCG